ncbi:hypothetical protein LXA43DRAFT_1186379 [Ganoderma leucocontextum]|nr:hypothetical protein LXA43DRAFT_1186379 [Ganoderma leucocontextum]
MPDFAVYYTPDYTDEGAIERRFKLQEVGGAMLSQNEALDTPNAACRSNSRL